MILVGSSPFHGADVKQILVKTAESRFNFKHPLLGKQSVEMHTLLRGLLSPDTYKRLTPIEALAFPAFDNYRGYLLPPLREVKIVYLDDNTFIAILEDDDVFLEGSIRNFEDRSIKIGPKERSYHAFSVNSNRLEGESPKLTSQSHRICQINENGCPTQMGSYQSSILKKQSGDIESAGMENTTSRGIDIIILGGSKAPKEAGKV